MFLPGNAQREGQPRKKSNDLHEPVVAGLMTTVYEWFFFLVALPINDCCSDCSDLESYCSAEKDLPNKLCELAETLYHEKVATREWSGATTKGKASSFTAGSASAEHVTCWNCGDSGHSLQVCPKAKNQPAIALRKKAQQKIWKANGTSSGGGRGQGRGGGRGNGGGRGRGRGRGEGIPTEPNFPLPTAQENNKRVIGGKPMFFIKSRNLWVADKYPPEAPAAHVATTPPVAIQPPPAAGLVATASNAAARQQAIDVAVANATRSMGTANAIS